MIKKKLNILFIIESIELAGLENVVFNLANVMVRGNYKIHICAIKKIRNDAFKLLDKRIELLSLVEFKNDYHRTKALIKYLNRHKIDIIHNHNWGGLPISYLTSIIKKTVLIHTEHGRDSTNPVLKIREKVQKLILYNLINNFTCVSKDLCDYFVSEFAIKKSKIICIYNGEKTKKLFYGRQCARYKLKIVNNDFVIGTVANPRPVKNLAFLISSIKILVEKLIPIKLIIVGGDIGGTELNKLKDLTNELKLNDRVYFLGRRTDVGMILPAFDVYVNCSLFEGVSCSILEAMSNGLPIVASDVGGNKELISHGKNGFLFEVNNIKEFVQYTIKIYNSNEIRNKFAKMNQKLIKKYNLEKQQCRYEKLYIKTIQL